MITFAIPGKPMGKQRHRTGKGRAYTPAQTVAYERAIAWAAKPHFPKPLDGPVRLRVIAIFAPGKSLSKREREARLHRPHTQKPDGDNIIKVVKDGLNGVAYHDDSQVAQGSYRKVWGLRDEVVVHVESLAGE